VITIGNIIAMARHHYAAASAAFLTISLLASLGATGATAKEAPRFEPSTQRSSEEGYRRLDLADLNNHPDRYRGRRVALTAEVISVNANCRSLQLFDATTKALIDVSLSRLRKSERRALIADPVHRVSVYGRVSAERGRYVVRAEKVEPLASEQFAQNFER
jgi:hypothetical protein